MEIYLEGSQELPWMIEGEGSFSATNPVSKMKLSVRRREITEVEFPNLKSTLVYELTILVNPESDSMSRMYTTVHTGDYNRKCDKLLESLHRTAQKIAQVRLLTGDAQVSTG
jgi:hypothetical protein